MKRLLLSFFLVPLLIFPLQTFAASGNAKGTVNTLRYISSSQPEPSWQRTAWFKLNGVTQAGSCSKRSAGDLDGDPDLILFRVPAGDLGAFSLLIAAQTQGKAIAVHWNDASKVDGYCEMKYLTLE